ncbi:MAG: hypothetical protein K5908_09505 [Erysipelotrichaceae bacterium]|nr:hypothetical protein [Erysipelotrichaceae bacterium]
MNNLYGLDVKSILLLLLAVLIIFGIVKRIFKLAFFVAVIGVLYFLITYVL